VKLKIKGKSPMLQNRDSIMYDKSVEPRNTKSESYEEYEERIWRKKAHYNDDGIVVCPYQWIRKGLIASQALSANPIKPPNARRNSATLKQNFISGIIITENFPIIGRDGPVTEKDLVEFRCMVSPQKGKVLCIRPMIQLPWYIDIEIYISDSTISEKNVLECMEWCGHFNGIGDWRPQKGGIYGMFDIEK